MPFISLPLTPLPPQVQKEIPPQFQAPDPASKSHRTICDPGGKLPVVGMGRTLREKQKFSLVFWRKEKS